MSWQTSYPRHVLERTEMWMDIPNTGYRPEWQGTSIYVLLLLAILVPLLLGLRSIFRSAVGPAAVQAVLCLLITAGAYFLASPLVVDVGDREITCGSVVSSAMIVASSDRGSDEIEVEDQRTIRRECRDQGRTRLFVGGSSVAVLVGLSAFAANRQKTAS